MKRFLTGRSIAMILTGAAFVVANVIPANLGRTSFVVEWGWPFRYRHVCDVCAAEGGYTYPGRLLLDVLVGVLLVLAVRLLCQRIAQRTSKKRGANGDGLPPVPEKDAAG